MSVTSRTPDVTIRSKLRPGDIGSVTYLHGTLYAAEYGWDYTFEAYVAGPLAEFGKSHSDRERIWIVYSRVLLWTEGALAAATRLYQSSGFRLTRENIHELWGTVVTEQRYELSL